MLHSGCPPAPADHTASVSNIPHTAPCARKQLLRRCLAPFERLASEVVTVELKQVEGVEEHAGIMAPIGSMEAQ
jgi:hypothetical protein